MSWIFVRTKVAPGWVLEAGFVSPVKPVLLAVRAREPCQSRARRATAPGIGRRVAKLEQEIGHRFRNDLAMADIITAVEHASPANPATQGQRPPSS